MRITERIRTWLFGSAPPHGGRARRIGAALIRQITLGGIRTLSDEALMELVDYLLTTPQLRTPLRGNTRFLESVSSRYHRNRRISDRQRHAIHNILERAYPHNLAAELGRFSR